MAVINKIRKNGLDYDIQDQNALSINEQELTSAQKTKALENLGITSTPAELNILDGAAVKASELNQLSGATSNIQTQLNNKIDSPSNPTDGQFISYDAASGKWKNIDAPDASGGNSFKITLQGGAGWKRDPIVNASYVGNKMTVTVTPSIVVSKAGFSHYDSNTLMGQGYGTYTVTRNSSTNTWSCAQLGINNVGASSLGTYGLALSSPDNCAAGDTITVTVNWTSAYQIITDAANISNIGYGYIISPDVSAIDAYNTCEIKAVSISGNSMRFEPKIVSVNNLSVNGIKIILSSTTTASTIHNTGAGFSRPPRIFMGSTRPLNGELQVGDYWYKTI